MGDSVAEGTVLEWHKQEGDTVAADETIVEISTDKVDAEVPAPVAGTVAGSSRPRGHGRRSAPCSPRSRPATANGTAAQRRSRRSTARPARAARRRPSAEVAAARGPRDRRDRHADRRRVGHRGHDPRVVGEGRRRGRRRRHGRRDLDRQGRHGAARARGGTITEILAGEGDTVNVGQVIGAHDRRRDRDAAARARPAPARGAGGGAARRARRQRRQRQRLRRSPGASPPPRASTGRASPAPPAAAGSPRPTCSPPATAPPANGAAPAPPARR